MNSNTHRNGSQAERDRETSCPGCNAPGMYSFYELKNVPVNVGRVVDSREEARSVTLGDIDLCYCHCCGLVHNVAFDPSRVSFEPGYEVALHHSPTFRDFIQGVASRLVERYDLHDKDILDIGCGAGYFLETMCTLGGNRGTGVDPTVPRVGHVECGAGSMNLIRDFWAPRYAGSPVDFITSQSVFEDFKQPLQFLTELRRRLVAKPVPFYCEVFNGFRAFEQQETWSIHFEACSYFSLEALQNVFRVAGYRILDADYCYAQDQYLYVEVLPESNSPATRPPVTEIPQCIREFSQLHNRTVTKWQQRLADWKANNRNVVLWGSGAKGVNFLTTLQDADIVRAVVDINPDRQGKYMPGSGHLIVPPESLSNNKPDHVILTNQIYRSEVEQQLTELGVSCELLVA